jgi:hypothetical protein
MQEHGACDRDKTFIQRAQGAMRVSSNVSTDTKGNHLQSENDRGNGSHVTIYNLFQSPKLPGVST